MGDELSEAMNLGLNLSPISDQEPLSGLMPSETVNLAEFMEEPARRIRGTVRLRTRQQRLRWRRLHIPPETRNISMESNESMCNAGSLQAGEGGSVSRTCENNNGLLKEDGSPKKVDTEKGCGDDRSFYDCNICLNMAKDPVVTPCGHLFCWPCLYHWLHEFSKANECPVCKGKATIQILTPIYGCGSSTREAEGGSGLNIPVRPRAWQAELVSWAQFSQLARSQESLREEVADMRCNVEERFADMRRYAEELHEAWRVTREKQLQWNANAAREQEQILALLKEGGQCISPAAAEAMLRAFLTPTPVFAPLPPLPAIAPLPLLPARAPLPPVPALAPPLSDATSHSDGEEDEGSDESDYDEDGSEDEGNEESDYDEDGSEDEGNEQSDYDEGDEEGEQDGGRG